MNELVKSPGLEDAVPDQQPDHVYEPLWKWGIYFRCHAIRPKYHHVQVIGHPTGQDELKRRASASEAN